MEPIERMSDSPDTVGADQTQHRPGVSWPWEIARNLRPRVGPRRDPGYGLVLVAIVLAIILLAAGYGTTVGRFLALVVLAAALLLALRAAQVPDRLQRRAALLVCLGLLGGLLSILTATRTGGFDQAVALVLVAATPVVLARRLVRDPEVTRDSIIGALCVYLLIALFFTFVFVLTTEITGTPFFASVTDAAMADYLYFSYVTLSTVGYGDFVARTNLGRMLSVTEALTGQLYLVTVVALLVSNLRQATPNRQQ